MTFSPNTKQRKTFFYKGLAITDEMRYDIDIAISSVTAHLNGGRK